MTNIMSMLPSFVRASKKRLISGTSRPGDRRTGGVEDAEGQPSEGSDTAKAMPSPDDNELAGLLGVLGLDAYTHDQLVAKDEGEEASWSSRSWLPSSNPC